MKDQNLKKEEEEMEKKEKEKKVPHTQSGALLHMLTEPCKFCFITSNFCRVT